MDKFVICTDSSCDLSADALNTMNVKCVSLTFKFDGCDVEYYNGEMSSAEFYARMRRGDVAKTAGVNAYDFEKCFRSALDEQKSVLYIGFSSGLSTTYNSARIAAEELGSEYKNLKIKLVDSLCASAGLGLLVRIAADKRAEGLDIDQVSEYIESIKLSVCHWFTVDDLVYLKRGGRISPTLAFVGNVLGIKPVMHVDNDGHLVNVSKVRGRRHAIMALADKYSELALTPERGYVYISHGDCIKDAEFLANIIKERHGNLVDIITDVGPVIGAHSGPGTLALFFVGKER